MHRPLALQGVCWSGCRSGVRPRRASGRTAPRRPVGMVAVCARPRDEGGPANTSQALPAEVLARLSVAQLESFQAESYRQSVRPAVLDRPATCGQGLLEGAETPPLASQDAPPPSIRAPADGRGGGARGLGHHRQGGIVGHHLITCQLVAVAAPPYHHDGNKKLRTPHRWSARGAASPVIAAGGCPRAPGRLPIDVGCCRQHCRSGSSAFGQPVDEWAGPRVLLRLGAACTLSRALAAYVKQAESMGRYQVHSKDISVTRPL